MPVPLAEELKLMQEKLQLVLKLAIMFDHSEENVLRILFALRSVCMQWNWKGPIMLKGSLVLNGWARGMNVLFLCCESQATMRADGILDQR